MVTICCRKSSDAIAKSTGCKGCYSLMSLPHHDPLIQCVPDAMHTVKDVLEKLFGLLTGREDTPKVQQCEKTLGRFSTTRKRLHSTTPRTTAPYRLTKEELLLADERALSIVTPAYIDFKPTAMFVKPTYHKSHDWKQVGILRYNTYRHYITISNFSDWVTGDPQILFAWLTQYNTTSNHFSIHRFSCKAYKGVYQEGRIGRFEGGAQHVFEADGRGFPPDFTGIQCAK